MWERRARIHLCVLDFLKLGGNRCIIMDFSFPRPTIERKPELDHTPRWKKERSVFFDFSASLQETDHRCKLSGYPSKLRLFTSPSSGIPTRLFVGNVRSWKPCVSKRLPTQPLIESASPGGLEVFFVWI